MIQEKLNTNYQSPQEARGFFGPDHKEIKFIKSIPSSSQYRMFQICSGIVFFPDENLHYNFEDLQSPKEILEYNTTGI